MTAQEIYDALLNLPQKEAEKLAALIHKNETPESAAESRALLGVLQGKGTGLFEKKATAEKAAAKKKAAAEKAAAKKKAAADKKAAAEKKASTAGSEETGTK